MGGVGNRAAEEAALLVLGLKPRGSSLAGRAPLGFGESQNHMDLGCSLFSCGLGSRRHFAWKKGGERTLAGET